MVPASDGRDRKGKCCDFGSYSPSSMHRAPPEPFSCTIFPEDINSVHTLTYWRAFYSSISSPVCFPEHEIAKGRGRLLISLTMSSLDAPVPGLANDNRRQAR